MARARRVDRRFGANRPTSWTDHRRFWNFLTTRHAGRALEFQSCHDDATLGKSPSPSKGKGDFLNRSLTNDQKRPVMSIEKYWIGWKVSAKSVGHARS